MTPDDFRLTYGERSSAAWHRIERYLTHRLDRARKRNDGALSAEETAMVRGEIAALKGLLALGEQPISPPFGGDERPDTEHSSRARAL